MRISKKQQILNSHNAAMRTSAFSIMLKLNKIMPPKKETLKCLHILKNPGNFRKLYASAPKDMVIDFVNAVGGIKAGKYINKVGVKKAAWELEYDFKSAFEKAK